jgi:thiol-disulfide isomerase/thioredoxin
MTRAFSKFSLLLAASAMAFSLQAADYPEPNAIGTPLPDFELPGIEGSTYEVKTYTKDSFADAKLLALVFTCNHCPTAQRYEDRLIQLTKDYADKGVAIVAVNPNNAEAVRLDEMAYTDLGDTFEDMQVRAEHKGFNFAYLDDGPTQEFSRKVGPIATPHVFIYDEDRKLAFQGRIDDAELPQYIKHQDTRAALDALLAGKKPENPTTRVFGCSVKWAEKAAGYNAQWAENLKKEPVTLEKATAADFVALRENKDSGKLRLINVWATWCGPCVTEFPDLVDTNVTFRGRDFEMVTIAAEYPNAAAKALKFLEKQHASSQNYIFGDTDKYANIEAIDPEWNGALPHTLLVNEKGEVIFRHTGPLDFLELKRVIVPALDKITPWGGLDGN